MVEGSVSRDPKSLKVRFDVNDIGPSITVEYEGILPDLFREGQGIVAQGVLKEPTLLEATEVLAKHDENYVPPELGEKMKKMHKPMGAELKRREWKPIVVIKKPSKNRKKVANDC